MLVLNHKNQFYMLHNIPVQVKSIPFNGTGKHKYSFKNIEVPPLPVHFCDCEEHCSPFVTKREKLSIEGAVERGGMNDEEISIMNSVMNKLFGKENVSNAKNLGEKESFQSPDALHSDECEDSATDEDDLIINMETKKSKKALIGNQELERILENQVFFFSSFFRVGWSLINLGLSDNVSFLLLNNKCSNCCFNLQELWFNKTKIAKEEPNKSMPRVQNAEKRINSIADKSKKRKKSLPKSEMESNGEVSTTPGGKSNLRTFPDEVGSGAQPTELEDDDSVELTRVSWSQKSSWRKLLGEGGNTAFSASLILPKLDCGKIQGRSDDVCAALSTKNKTQNMERDGNLRSKPTNTQVIEELAKAQLTNKQVIEELAEAQPTNTQVIEELAEAQLTNTQVIEEFAEAQHTNKHVNQDLAENQHNVAPNKTGRGASWLRKQSWTQLVSENNNSFSISHILPGFTFPEPMAKEPVVEPVNPNDCKHNGVAKDSTNEVVSDGFNPREIVPEKSQHIGANDIASASVAEEKVETSPREGSTENVEIGETCSFMRSAASLKAWAKAKAAMSGSLKRKRGEK